MITHDERRKMSALLTEDRQISNSATAALTLGCLTSPEQVRASIVTLDPESGAMRALLVTEKLLIHGEFAMDQRNVPPSSSQTWEPEVWVRRLSDVVSLEVRQVDSWSGGAGGTDVHPTYTMSFRSTSIPVELVFPWIAEWKSQEDANAIAGIVLEAMAKA